MKLSGKMCLMIILKVTKKQGFTLCLEDTLFEKPQGVGQIESLPPPRPTTSCFRVNDEIDEEEITKQIEFYFGE